MSGPPPWLSRTFEFTLPVHLHATQRARLRGTPARLVDATQDLPRDLLIRRIDDAWSIQENVGHLLDLEPLWQARLEQFLSGAAELTAADVRNQKTYEARHNDQPLDAILASFRESRLRWVDRLDALPPGEFARVALHPRLRVSIRLIDHLFFVAEHDDHHLARIHELRTSSS